MSTQEANGRMIGTISNFDQSLYIKEENGKFWWNIATYPSSGTKYWQEIPEYLFQALNLFQDTWEQEQADEVWLNAVADDEMANVGEHYD
jgi:hypothetical protein